ncbi:MAG: hypothetical protein ACKVLA_00250 [Rhodobacterales bacterium]
MTTRLTPRLGGALFVALIGSAATAEGHSDAGREIFNNTAQPPCAIATR